MSLMDDYLNRDIVRKVGLIDNVFNGAYMYKMLDPETKIICEANKMGVYFIVQKGFLTDFFVF